MWSYRFYAFLLQFGLLQIEAFLGDTEPFPALTDSLVDLRLWEIGDLLLHELVDVEVIEQVRRPERDDAVSGFWGINCSFRPCVIHSMCYLGFLGLSTQSS